jgi:two-component system, NarL family, response regulator NreC
MLAGTYLSRLPAAVAENRTDRAAPAEFPPFAQAQPSLLTSVPSPDRETPTTVILVDGEGVVRAGLRLLIEQSDHLTVVADVASMTDALALELQPSVVVTHVDLPDGAGRQVVTTLRRHFASASVLVLSPMRHPARIQAVIAAGADGYLLRSAEPEDLAQAITAVARGETYLQPSLGVALAQWSSEGTSDAAAGVRLSVKEEEVLRLIALGYKNSEIAQQLSVSLRTVETHRGRLSQKLGRRTRAELVRYAMDAGILHLS